MYTFSNSRTGKRRPVFSLLSPAPLASYLGTGQLAGTYGEAATVTRANAKICETSASTVASVSSGQASVEPRGLRVEAAHTNLLLQSQAFDNAAWTAQGVIVAAPTVTPNAAVAPDGTMTADRVDFVATLNAGETCGLYQSIPTTAGAYSFSVWIKGVSGSGHIYWLQYDGSFETPIAIPFTTEWTRVTLSQTLFTSLASATELGYSAAWTGGTGGPASVYMWGAQLETGAYAHSYVPTTSATVTCAADQVSVSASGLPVAVGSVEFDFVPEWSTSPGTAVVLLDTEIDTGHGGIQIYVAALTLGFFTRTGSSTGGIVSSNLSWTPGQRYAIRAVWGGGNLSLYRDNVLVASDLTGTALMPDAQPQLLLGQLRTGAAQCDGWLSNLRFYA